MERAIGARGAPPLPARLRPPASTGVSAALHELAEVPVRDRGGVDVEGPELDRVPRALVVVGEALAGRPHRERPRLDAHDVRLRGARLGRRMRPAGRLVDAGLGERERLQHRLVVLMLVLHEHVPHEPSAVEPAIGGGRYVGLVEDSDGALAHRVHEVARLGQSQVGDLGPHRPRRLGRVVEVGELGAQGVEPADPLAEPEVLEGGDVAEVPDERAHQRIVDPIHVRFRNGVDERERALAGLLEQRAPVPLRHGLSPSTGQCFRLRLAHERDAHGTRSERLWTTFATTRRLRRRRSGSIPSGSRRPARRDRRRATPAPRAPPVAHPTRSR